jgi:hypothetical protein
MFPFDPAQIRRIEYEDRDAGGNLLKKALIETLENLMKQKPKTIEDTRQDGSLLRINRLGLLMTFILVVQSVIWNNLVYSTF